MIDILKNRSLLILAAAEVVSALGSWITTMALFAVLIFEGEGGVGHTSALFLAGFAPAILLGPMAGWMADRFERRRLLIASQLLSGAAVSMLIFTERLELIYLALVLQSIAGSVMSPTRQAVIPDLVGRANLTRANAFMQQLIGLIKIAAPMLAGLVLTLMSPQQAIILDVVSYGLAAATLTMLPVLPAAQGAQRRVTEARAESGWAEFRRTVAGINRQAPLLRFLILPIFVMTTTLMAYDISAAVFTRDVLRAGADFMGLSIGLVGVGTGASALALMLAKRERNPWQDLLCGFILITMIPVALTLAAWVENPLLGRWLVLGGSVVGGLGLGLSQVQAQTLIQLLAPEGWLGRLSGLFQSLAVAGQVTGLLLTPLIVPAPVSFGLFFGVTAAVMLLLTLGVSLVAWRSGSIAPHQPSPAGD